MSNPRLTTSQRITGSLLGAIVTATGGIGIAVFSGYEIDLELVGIAVLAAAGAWLLLSALFGGAGRRSVRDDGYIELRTKAHHAAHSARISAERDRSLASATGAATHQG